MQIQVKPYNNAPDAKELQNYLDTHLAGYFMVADANRPYWKNDNSTLVLRHDPNGMSLDFYAGLGLGKMACHFHADEFDSIVEDYVTYYRLWWD